MQMIAWKCLQNYGRYIRQFQLGKLCGTSLVMLLLCQDAMLRGEEVSAVPQIAFINTQVELIWADAGVEPVEQATELEWCRRVYLDLIGRIPTVDEVLRYKNDHSRDKQAVLVDRLLGDEYVHEYAKHWSNVWTTVLIGRDADNRMVDRSGMRKYLQTAWESNIPYDQFVEELLTATGDNADEGRMPQLFNGATNFLSGKLR